MKKISILIAHYNNFEYFKDCYNSLILQTYTDFEIVIVDDCSTDDSFQKISLLTKNDSRFKLYQNLKNNGVGFTKRKCIDLASGEICGFLDPDDVLAKNAIEISLKNHNQDNIATYSSFMLCNNNLEPLRKFEHSRAVKNNDKMFFNVFFEVNHFFTFKKYAYLKTIGIDKKLTSAVDQDLYLKLYDVGQFTYIKETLYLYRLHTNGVSQDLSKKNRLNENWDKVLRNTLKRRQIDKIYGKFIDEIPSLPIFLKRKQNNIINRLIRKLS